MTTAKDRFWKTKDRYTNLDLLDQEQMCLFEMLDSFHS